MNQSYVQVGKPADPQYAGKHSKADAAIEGRKIEMVINKPVYNIYNSPTAAIFLSVVFAGNARLLQ